MNNINFFENRQALNQFQDYSEYNKENINFVNTNVRDYNFSQHVENINENFDYVEKSNNYAHINQSLPEYTFNTHSSLSSREVGVFNKVGKNGVNVEYKKFLDTINKKYTETSVQVKAFINKGAGSKNSQNQEYISQQGQQLGQEIEFSNMKSESSSEMNNSKRLIQKANVMNYAANKSLKRPALMEIDSDPHIHSAYFNSNFFIENETLYIPLFKKYNAHIPHEYLLDIWETLKSEEIMNTANYFNISEQKDINEKMRAILIDWLVDVHSKFNLTSETLFLTVNIVDRYISSKQVLRSKLQLIGVAALMIACKYEEILCPDIRDFVFVTDKTYSKPEILQAEKEILNTLQFNVTVPTSLRFFEIIALNFNFNTIEFSYGKYLMEFFMIDPKMNKYTSSLIALSVAYIIMKMNNYANYKDLYNLLNKTVSVQCQSNTKSLKDCAKDIFFIAQNARSLSKLQAVFNIFSAKENHRVAVLGMGSICIRK